MSSKRSRIPLWGIGLLVAFAPVLVGGCVAQPAESVAPTQADFQASIEAALGNLEKLPPEGRKEAKESLDELFETRATPEQRKRYEALVSGASSAPAVAN